LFVSTGKESKEFADYVGRDIEQTLELLDGENFKSVEQVAEFSDEPEGTILEQEPRAGEEVIVSETDVEFVVSKGKDMRTVENITGYTEDDLNEYARSSGFNIRIIGEEASENAPAGTVLTQNPAADKQLEAGSTIEV